MNHLKTALIATAAATITAIAPASYAGTVTANNQGGDAFTNPGTNNAGQAVGSSGWYYNNVRANGVAGIDGTYARSGNGSVHFSGPANAKADVEFLPGALAIGGNNNSTGALGALSAFSGMSYDWLRDSISTNDVRQMPALRVLIDADGNIATTGDRGGLVFERVYNEGADSSAAPTNLWTTETIGANSFVWNFGLGLTTGADINGSGYGYDETLAQWKTLFPNAVVIGFSSGIGSGWNGSFDGAVDNIAWTIGGVTTTNNFETVGAAAVPEPETLSLLAAAMIGLALVARRRRSR
ncbi:MAG: PEP-CTERM sorting domain-containing protein [Burkholderiaceae bacterium]